MVADRRDDAADEEPAAVLAEVPAVVAGLTDRRGRLELPLRHAGLPVLGGEQDGAVLADDLVLGVTEDPLGSHVPGIHPAGGIEREDRVVVDTLEDLLTLRFGPGQGGPSARPARLAEMPDGARGGLVEHLVYHRIGRSDRRRLQAVAGRAVEGGVAERGTQVAQLLDDLGDIIPLTEPHPAVLLPLDGRSGRPAA